jgi:SP family general alpha glucoside:H+ symporter-like MFS transporter
MASSGREFANRNQKTEIIEDGHLGVGTATAHDGALRRMSVIPGIAEISDGALAGTNAEKRMGIMEGLRLYPKAVGWSMLLSTAIIMEGYDVVLLGSFYAFPEFKKQYGVALPDGTYEVPAAWQSGLSNGANIGEILGLFINGIVSEKIGYRKTMIGSLILVICFIFIQFFSENVETLLVGEILCGIPWGVFQTLTTAYAAEVMPVPLRCYLTTYVNLCWVMGQFIASGVLRGMLSNQTKWAYKIPFALQWMWPLPIIIGTYFAPESPWWLVRKEKIEDAKRALLRLTSKNDPNFNVDDTIDMMIHTNALEKEMSAGTSYLDCFRGIDLRRTEIVVVVWAIQNLCGSAFMGYSTYFYIQAGLSTENSFNLSMAQYALGAVGTILSWFAMSRMGRRTLYMYGLLILDVLLLIIGFVGIAQSSSAASWAIGSMLLVYTFTCKWPPCTYHLRTSILD